MNLVRISLREYLIKRAIRGCASNTRGNHQERDTDIYNIVDAFGVMVNGTEVDCITFFVCFACLLARLLCVLFARFDKGGHFLDNI